MVQQINCLQEQIVCIHVFGPLPSSGPELGFTQIRRKAPRDTRRDPLRQIEQLREVTVITVDPNHRTAFHV